MSYSYNFLFHLLAFAVVAGTLISMTVIHGKACTEPDWGKKLYLGGVMRTFALFGPYMTVVLLLTGFGNMINRYGMEGTWTIETWLEIKIALFIILAISGGAIGPRLSIKRTALIKSVVENNGPANAEELLAKQNRAMWIFLAVQAVLLLSIVVLSAFGSGKHPGIF